MVIHTQHFIRWALASLKHQRKLITIMWDNHLISTCNINASDSKYLDNYKEKLQGLVKKFASHKNQQGSSLSHHFLGFDKFIAQKKSVQFNNKQKKDVVIKSDDHNINDAEIMKIIESKAQANFKIGTLLQNLNMVSASQNIMTVDQNFKPTENEKDKVLNSEQIEMLKTHVKENQSLGGIQKFVKQNSQNLEQNLQVQQESKKKVNIQDSQEFSEDNNPTLKTENNEMEKSAHGKPKKNSKFQKRRGCVIQQQAEEVKQIEISSSLLPYSHHSDQVTLQGAFRYKNDKIRKNQQCLDLAISAEIRAKKQIIEHILRVSRQRYQEELKKYHNGLEKFMLENKDKINQKRAQLMISIPFTTLKEILHKEEYEYKQKPGMARDHLPFYDMRQKIAESLPGAKSKPQFSIVLTFEEFRKLHLPQYLKFFQREIQIMEKEGKFSMKRQLKDKTKEKEENKQEIKQKIKK